MKIKLHFAGKTSTNATVVAYLMNEIGQTKIADYVAIIEQESSADVVIDVSELKDKEQITKARGFIVRELWTAYHNKKKPLQQHGGKYKQKKFRKK